MTNAYDWNREDRLPPPRRSSASRPQDVIFIPRRTASPPPPAREPSSGPRQALSRRRRRARRARQERWGRALLALMLAVIAVGSAGRALSDAARSQPRAPQGTSAAPVDPDHGWALSANNIQPIDVPEWVDQQLLPLNEYSRPGNALLQVNGVVVHYVGNPGTTAEQNRSYFANLAQTGETYASSHFVIGMDGAVVQCVPLDEIAYCSTTRNADTISIECCHPDQAGQFTPETADALVKLLDWLIETYALDREDVIRHYDVAGKECPIYYVRHPEAWTGLLDRLTFPT